MNPVRAFFAGAFFASTFMAAVSAVLLLQAPYGGDRGGAWFWAAVYAASSLVADLSFLGAAVRGLPPPWNDKERHLRWMEMMWDRHQTNAREERRTREVVEVFEGIAEISRRRMEAPHFPPRESPW